jgi:hypothetical protein
MSSSIVKSTSFEKDNFVCLSCISGHKLLPRKRNKGQWEGGRKLIVLTDQNFGPVLKMSENNCPVIIRVEGGWLSEIGYAFVSSLGDNFTGHHVPEGSVVLLGSLSDQMSQGPQGHAKSLCAEVRRLNGLFQFHNTVTVVPFIPIPLYGTNSSSLVMGMVDITEWLDSVQKPPLSGYNSAVRSYILSSVWEGGEGEAGRATLNFPPHPLVLPDNIGVHSDKIFTCNGVSELPMSIPPLSSDTESSLYTPLIEGLNAIYKWNMDTVITVDRESSTLSRDE